MFLAVGCLPSEHALVGGRCDASHLCGGTLTCFDGVCLAEAPGRVNLLTNGDFEQGASGWDALGASLAEGVTGGRSSSHALWVHGDSTRPSSSSPLGVKQDLAPPSPETTYCATAQLQSTAPVSLLFKRYSFDGGYDNIERQALPSGGWTQVTVTARNQPPYYEAFYLRLSRPYAPDAGFLVDDVSAWISTDGGCEP